MIENILYEIDNAFNESENNVLEAIQESCYKALEILENSSDDIDVSCFGVFQEAVATMEKPETKTDKSTNNDENTDTTNKEEDQKIEKIVTINPRALAAAEKFKADKKKKTEENLSKLATVNAKIITKYEKYADKLQSIFKSKGFKDLLIFIEEYPNRISTLAKAFNEYKVTGNIDKNKDEHVSEWTTGIMDDANEKIKSGGDTVDIPDTIAKAITTAIVENNKRVTHTDMLVIVEYFVQKYNLTKDDTQKIYEALIKEENNFIKDQAKIVDVTKKIQKEYEKKFKYFENSLKALATYTDDSNKKFAQKILMDMNKTSVANAPKSFEMLDREYDSKLKTVGKYPASIVHSSCETIVSYWKKIWDVLDNIKNKDISEDIKRKILEGIKDFASNIKINKVTAATSAGKLLLGFICKILFADTGVTTGIAAGATFGGIMFGTSGAVAGATTGAIIGPIIVSKIVVGIIKTIAKGVVNITASIM